MATSRPGRGTADVGAGRARWCGHRTGRERHDRAGRPPEGGGAVGVSGAGETDYSTPAAGPGSRVGGVGRVLPGHRPRPVCVVPARRASASPGGPPGHRAPPAHPQAGPSPAGHDGRPSPHARPRPPARPGATRQTTSRQAPAPAPPHDPTAPAGRALPADPTTTPLRPAAGPAFPAEDMSSGPRPSSPSTASHANVSRQRGAVDRPQPCPRNGARRRWGRAVHHPAVGWHPHRGPSPAVTASSRSTGNSLGFCGVDPTGQLRPRVRRRRLRRCCRSITERAGTRCATRCRCCGTKAW
jgi:hypothetical protein